MSNQKVPMTTNLKSSAQRVQEILQKYNLGIQVVEFASTTRTSQEAAQAIGCEVAQIAKTLIFKGKNSDKPICVIASGKNRVDEKKLETHIGEPVERSDAEFVVKYTGFAIGGVPPVGYEFDVKPLIDEDLMSYEFLWAAAGTPYCSFKILPKDLLHITQGQLVNIKR